MKDTGDPEMSDSEMLFQSSSLTLSTMAQPWKKGLPVESSTTRYVVFHIGAAIV